MSVYENNLVELWDLRTCEIVSTYTAKHKVQGVDFSARGSVLFTLEGGTIHPLVEEAGSLIPRPIFGGLPKFTDFA